MLPHAAKPADTASELESPAVGRALVSSLKEEGIAGDEAHLTGRGSGDKISVRISAMKLSPGADVCGGRERGDHPERVAGGARSLFTRQVYSIFIPGTVAQDRRDARRAAGSTSSA